jgi:hypothetical protein
MDPNFVAMILKEQDLDLYKWNWSYTGDPIVEGLKEGRY